MQKYSKGRGLGQGWHFQSARHSLARRGIKTKVDYAEMSPRFDSRQSFYGKADVRDEGGRLVLKSYGIDVAYIDGGTAVVRGTYSATTLRHIKEFLKQHGFKAESSSQIMSDYGLQNYGFRERSGSQKGIDYAKSWGYKDFRIDDHLTVNCHGEDTRNGFKHVCDVFRDGLLIGSAKVNYLNRTWERYEFESVIKKVLDSVGLDATEKQKVLSVTSGRSREESDSMFKSVGMVAKLGDIFGKTPKESNDWKLRMIKAGLGNKGLQVPEDWDTLSESDKQKRLNNVIKLMDEKKPDYAKKDFRPYAILTTGSNRVEVQARNVDEAYRKARDKLKGHNINPDMVKLWGEEDLTGAYETYGKDGFSVQGFISTKKSVDAYKKYNLGVKKKSPLEVLYGDVR